MPNNTSIYNDLWNKCLLCDWVNICKFLDKFSNVVYRHSMLYVELKTWLKYRLLEFKYSSTDRVEDVVTEVLEAVQRTPMDRTQCAELLGVGLTTLDKYVSDYGLPWHTKNPLAKRQHKIFYKDEVLNWQLEKKKNGFIRKQGKNRNRH